MHEYSIVEHMLDHLQTDLRQQGIRCVKAVRVRRGGAFAAEALLQAFQMLSKDTIFADAELIVDEFSVVQTCANCEKTQQITADDLIGHLFICPECGSLTQIDEAGGLEIVSVTVENEPIALNIKAAHQH